jgi:hypothetical protein
MHNGSWMALDGEPFRAPLRLIMLVLLLGCGAQSLPAQDVRKTGLQTVQNLVSECAPARPKVSVLFRSLVTSGGRLVKFDADSFYLKKNRRYYRSFYRDVLEFRCGGKFVSNVPDPSARAHGSWGDIRQVYGGTPILVILTDGRTVEGFSNSATDSHLIIIERKTHTRLDLPREEVAAFFGLIGGRGGVKTGAAKGSEGLLQPGGDPILGGVGAGIGAIIGALAKSDGRPMLVYSR